MAHHYISVALGANLGPLAVTPDNTRLYVVRDPISTNSEVDMVSLDDSL